MKPLHTRHAQRMRDGHNEMSTRWAGLVSIWVHMGLGMLLMAITVSQGPRDTHTRVLRLVGESPSDHGRVPAAASEPSLAQVPGLGGDAQGVVPTPAVAPGQDIAPPAAEVTAFDNTDRPTPVRDQPAQAAPLAPPPPVPGEDLDTWQTFVHVDSQQTDAPSSPTHRIAAHDSVTSKETRTPVTTDRDGPLTPKILGPDDTSATPTLERHAGEEASAMGNRAHPEASDPQLVSGGGGGGGGGEATGRGSRSREDHRLSGGPVARSGGGAGHPSAASATAGLPDAHVFPAAVRPDDNARGRDWWQPTAFRMVTSSPASTAAGQDSDVASHTSGDGVAVVETADISSDRGGSSRVETRERALPGMADLEDGPTDAPDMGSADPVQELREALGWGGIDREALAPRPEWAGTLEGRGARHTSPQTALDDVDISWRTAVNAQGTAVGRYIAQVEDIVGARWQNKDIGTFSRARGIQGQVTVQYRIQPNGRVTDIRLARSSGHTLLDQIALQAIPRKLPRFPSGLGREDIPHRIVLRYRNPLVGPSVFLP